MRVLVDADASVIAERRARGPSGRGGGDDGAPGRTTLNGDELPAKWRGALAAGDVLGIESPGGGGYGAAAGLSAASRAWWRWPPRWRGRGRQHDDVGVADLVAPCSRRAAARS